MVRLQSWNLKNVEYHFINAQSAGAVEFIDCFFAEGYDTSNKCPVYDTKQFDGKVPVMQEFWGMRSTSSLPSLPGLLGPE